MKSLIIFFLSVSNAATASVKKVESCESAREFITTFEFLKSHPTLFGTGDQAVKVANEVSKGCTGAAQRFSRVVNLLEKADLTAAEILNLAQALALKPDAVSVVYQNIFRKAYSQDGFDLDLRTSLDLARSLSADFKGNAEVAGQDFEKISDFCLKNIALSKPDCAKLAQRVSLLSDGHGEPTAQAFCDSYRYMIRPDGPALSIHDALKLSEDIIKIHPAGAANFRTAFDYAISEKGLHVRKDEAIKFAKEMAWRTRVESKSQE